MRFDAALRAAHDGGCFGQVHLLPVTQQEGFPLTRGQKLQFLFDLAQCLAALRLVFAAFLRMECVGCQQVQQRVGVRVALCVVKIIQV